MHFDVMVICSQRDEPPIVSVRDKLLAIEASLFRIRLSQRSDECHIKIRFTPPQLFFEKHIVIQLHDRRTVFGQFPNVVDCYEGLPRLNDRVASVRNVECLTGQQLDVTVEAFVHLRQTKLSSIFADEPLPVTPQQKLHTSLIVERMFEMKLDCGDAVRCLPFAYEPTDMFGRPLIAIRKFSPNSFVKRFNSLVFDAYLSLGLARRVHVRVKDMYVLVIQQLRRRYQ